MNHHLALALLPATLVLVATGPAQISATFIAKSKMIASAYYTGTGANSAEIAINTDLKGGKSASTSSGTARASVFASFAQSATMLRASVTESGNGYYSSITTRASAYTGPHQTLLTLTTPKPTNATLRVRWVTQVFGGTGAYSYGSVDIGNNGSFEFNGSTTSQTKDFPITIDSNGLGIVTSTRGSASGNASSRSASYSSTLSIEILPPQTCLFFNHGAPCGPTVTGANGFEDRVTIHVSGAASSGTGVLLLGVQRTSVSIPGSSCLLLVQPLVAVPLLFSASGTLSLTGTLPSSRPFALPLQVGSFGTTLGTSSALTIICP